MKPFLSFLKKALHFCVALVLISRLTDSPKLNAENLPAAVRRGDQALVQTLLQSNSDLNARDEDGNTALHWAALNGNADWVQEFIKLGALVNATNNVGASPLLYSVGNLDVVRALLNGGAEVNQASKHKSTPLISAARYPNSSEIVKLLLKHGADPKVQDGGGDTALDRAAYAGDINSVQQLLAVGVKPRNVNGAAMMGHYQIVRLALDNGADINFNGGFAGHSLNFSLYGQQPEIAKLLIERGADLTLRSPVGQHETPPILWAAYNERGDVSVARLMIEKGVDRNMHSAMGDSALDWARDRNNKSLEKMLQQAGVHKGTRVRKTKRIPNRKLSNNNEELSPLFRQAATRAIALLQTNSDGFLNSAVVKQQRCVSCHQQTLPAVAFGWARQRGFLLNETSLARQVQDQVRYWTRGEKISKTYEMIRPQPDWPVLLGYGLLGLSSLEYPADDLTDAMVWFLAASQKTEGSWPAADYRPPMEDGPIQGTALAIRTLQLYPLSGREMETNRRISLARAYLSKAKPISFNQQVFQLLGMGWADESPDQLGSFVTAIIEKQQSNGGWSQLEGLPSDSWATGQALVALNTVGGVDVADTVYQKGVRFLLRTQFDDGSWYVRSRAWPFQPHFESGFPHGKDQWISAGGTTWAVMALLLTQPKIESVSQVDWMSISLPDEPEESTAAVSARTDRSIGSPRVDFTHDIKPLFERSCAACHGAQAKRKKGKFNITTREHFLKGGQSGEPVVLVGNGNASAIIRMVTDQLEDLEMPPLSKRKKFPPLTLNEVALLKSWIDAGLPW